VLGIVQGLGEFLPISSSAHLILVPWLVGWPEHSLTFDVALHMGTLAALLVFFWRDWWHLIAAVLPNATDGGGPLRGAEAGARDGELVDGGPGAATRTDPEELSLRRKLLICLAVATVPAAIIGALFADKVEANLRTPMLVGLLLIVAAILLAAADRAGIQDRGMEAIGYGQALAIGCAQALALAPGVSRSGVTLAMALFLGLRREAAARFVFLMAAPITAGAGLFQLRHLFQGGIPADERAAFLVGIVASFLVGLAAIGGLLAYLRRRNLDVFVSYRIILGTLVILIAALHIR
jgi:undecaprenyl-diphosphatase